MTAVLSALHEQAEALKALQSAMRAVQTANSAVTPKRVHTHTANEESPESRRVSELEAELRQLKGMSSSRERDVSPPGRPSASASAAILAAVDAAVAARLPPLIEHARKQLRDEVATQTTHSALARHDQQRLNGLIHDEVAAQVAKQVSAQLDSRLDASVYPQMQHVLDACRALQATVASKVDRDGLHDQIIHSMRPMLDNVETQCVRVQRDVQQVSHQVDSKVGAIKQTHQSLQLKLEIFSTALEAFKTELTSLRALDDDSHARVVHDLSGLNVSAIDAYEPRIQNMIQEGLEAAMCDIRRALAQKVDHAVLEELMRHIASRDELRAMLDRKLKQDGRNHETIGSVARIFEAKISALKKEIGSTGMNSEQSLEVAKQEILDTVSRRGHCQARDLLSAHADEWLTRARNEMDLKLIGLKRDMIERFARRREQVADSSHVDNSRTVDSVGAPPQPIPPPQGVPIGDILANEEEQRNHQERIRTELRQFVIASLDSHYTDLVKETDGKVASLRCEVLDALRRAVPSPNSHSLTQLGGVSVTDMENAVKSITRDFDEKVYLVCSDVSAVKSAQEQILRRPLHRVAQWLWKSQTLKFGSAVPWNYQSLNTDPENFAWTTDSPHIRIHDGGLYEISFAFFTKAKPSIQLIVNGESVLSAINSSSYVVHHGSGFVVSGEGVMEQGCVSGLSLLVCFDVLMPQTPPPPPPPPPEDFLALPPKSTISLHYHGVKKQILGHGFLNLRRLH
ncbi:hypothetical protein SeLEV6574_g04924 [Synchytrium endobioticum]|uniref:Uncharacterized protein n=1 Tax=Synchytrium endobioticum TaxID=286115 RepID=A0A507CX33_9FUNG|nr:hypothetical protein SeLEV6574_g04924 [Synchytrium endobioticum]